MNRSFIRSIAILSGSNLVAQAINFITYLILPKYFYTPDDFGVFGLFLAIYYILFEIINLKMDQSVMLPESEKDARGLLGFSWSVAVALSGLVFIILFILNSIFGWMPIIIPAILSISLLMGGIIQPSMVLLNREQRYTSMGNVRIAQALATLGVSIGAYYLMHESLNGLIAGFLGGQLIALIIILSLVASPGIHLAGRSLVWKYSQFIRYGSLSAMISTLSRNLPVFVIKTVFGDSALGWYTLAAKYLNAPIGIFSVSVAQVYFKDASHANPEELKKLTRSVIVNILGLAVIPVLIVLFFGGGIFEFVFGPEWRPAGLMMQVLVLWYFVAYASGPVSMLLDVKMKLDWELSYNILLLLGRAAALLSAIWWKDVNYVLAVYTLVGIIFNVILLNYILKLSGTPSKTMT